MWLLMACFGIMMCKDEFDVIQVTINHLLTQVDEVIVADNGSTDGTRDLLADLPVTVMDDLESAYYQSKKMSILGHTAGERGADWVLPADADEIHCSAFGRIGDILAELDPSVMVAEAELYDHVATALDPDEPNPIERIAWRRTVKAPLPKVACRYRPNLVIEAGNHEASYGGPIITARNVFTIRHFPWRSADQMVRKVRNGAAAYAATDLPAQTGAHWRAYGQIMDEHGEEAVRSIFRQWFWSFDPEHDGLIRDPAPVQRVGGVVRDLQINIGQWSCVGGER